MNYIIKCLFIISLLCFSEKIYSQSFSQRADYDIYVKFDDTQNILQCSEKITYTNNSNDTLEFLYIHLYPNSFSTTHTQYATNDKFNGNGEFGFVTEKKMSEIDSLDFTQNGKDLDLYIYSHTPDIGKLYLSKPILPGETTEIKTSFRTKIPFPYESFGVKDSTYHISHWYPKVAVYDQYGWHDSPLIDPNQTYSDIGKYKVTLNIPTQYIVAGSGKFSSDTQNEEEAIEKLIEETKQNISNGQIINGFKKRNGRKIIEMEQDSIQDFAWIASKNYLAAERKITLPQSKKQIQIRCYFTEKNKDKFETVLENTEKQIIENSEKYFDFPFSEINITESFNFNEKPFYFPCLQIINFENSTQLGNNSDPYFLNIIAANYTQFPWIKNSISDFSDSAKYFSIRKYPQIIKKISKKISPYELWEIFASKGLRKHISSNDTTIFVPEDSYSTALFDYLENYIGKETYQIALKDFFNKFAFKHPYPNDLKNIIHSYSNKNIDWIFDTLMQKSIITDLSFSDYNKKNKSITIKNSTDNVLSAHISLYKNESLTKSYFSPLFCNETTINIPDSIDYIILNENRSLFEKRFDNNRFDLKKKKNPLRLDIYKFKDNVNKRNIHLYPFAFWTQTEGFTPILYITNQINRTKLIHFQLAPMYSLKHNNLVGEGKISANKYLSEGLIRQIQLFASYRSYYFMPNETDYRFNRFESGVNFLFRNKNNHQNIIHNLSLKYHLSNHEYQKYISENGTNVETKGKSTLNAFRVHWHYADRKQLNPREENIYVDCSKLFARVQGKIDGKIHYNSPKRYFSYSIYAGKYFFKKDEFVNNYDGRLSISGINSRQDIFFDHWFLGRNSSNSFFQQQTYLDYGTFYSNLINGKNWDWAISTTVKTTFPIDLPLEAYCSAGIFPNQSDGKTSIAWETGILLSIIPDFIEIAFPLIIDKKSKEILDLNCEKYINKIRFIINFEKLNVHKWLERPILPTKW